MLIYKNDNLQDTYKKKKIENNLKNPIQNLLHLAVSQNLPTNVPIYLFVLLYYVH